MSGPKLKTYEATFTGFERTSNARFERMGREPVPRTLKIEAIDRLDAASRIHTSWYVVGDITLTEKP